MKVKDAKKRLKELERLAKNMRLINQYFLNCTDEELEEIAETHGINCPIKKVTEEATEELYTIVGKYERAIEEAEIGDLNLR